MADLPASAASGAGRERAFFRLAIAVGVLMLALLTVAGVRAVQHSASSRTSGWTEEWSGGAWTVASVDPSGPAANLLQPGDRVIAVGADPRAARLGAHWRIDAVAPGQAYTIDVQRDGRPITATLPVQLIRDPYLNWVLIYLAIAAAYYLVAVMIAVAKPESRTVQYGFAASLLAAAFMTWLASRPIGGIQRDALSAVLGLSFPFHVVAALLFFNRFPQEVAAPRWWTVAIHAVVVAGSLVWLPRAWVTIVQLLPDSLATSVVDRSLGLVGAYRGRGTLVESAFAGAVLVLMFAVLMRNYRLLTAPGERRRVQLVLWTHTLAFVVPAVVALGGVAAQSIGLARRESTTLLTLTLAANSLLVISPISFGYAIVKHRVLGFRVFVRLGIQYLLAKNVLRAAAAVPAILIAYTVVSNPDRTVGEILFSGSSGGRLALIAAAGAGLRFRGPLVATIDRRFFRTAYDQEKILLRLVDAIKQLDSVPDISAMVSREIDTALHVARILIFYRSAETRNLRLGYTSLGDAGEPGLPADSPLLAEMARAPAARTRLELQGHCALHEQAWLERLAIELVVPITGIDRDLYGLMLVGEKRSEEPFASQDRNLLQMVASQVGAVYEILALREHVGQHQRIQAEVLARLDPRQINVVKECPACGRCYDSHVEQCAADGSALVLSLPVDRTLDGKYRLERLIGHGGMGAVYEATDVRLNRQVAVKVVRSAALRTGSAQRRFAREAQACGRLEHPNIVRVYDYGLAGETAYLVMEYVRGITWRAELQRLGAMPVATAAALLDQVLDGMQAAHHAGVLHRDLKPENLLVCGPIVKILDFGLAKVRESSFVDPKSLTMEGLTMGTLGYMSPEQLYGGEVDERTDVYAIGVIALETLTGRLALEGRFFHRAIDTELQRRLVVPATTEPQRRLASVMQRALAQDVSLRFASIAELRAALIPALRDVPDVPVNPAMTIDPAADTVALARPPEHPASTQETALPTEAPRQRT